ncbi:MAG: OsmC family protein [Chloroflexota bacterium]|nr:OsmC family protein [Chloroflexota bacterium]
MRRVGVSFDIASGRFIAAGSHAAHVIAINAPRAPGEKRGSTGFSATELLLAGAGACSAWDVVEIMRKRRQDLASLDVTVEGQQADEAPWAYERIALHFRLQGRRLPLRAVERVVRLSCVRYCSVLATVRGVAQLEATIELLDEEGRTSGRRPISLALEPAEPLEDVLPAAEPAVDEA